MAENILIIDDTLEVTRTLQLILEGGGYNVYVCYSGKEALERIAGEKPDVILLDVMMPGMDGFEVCQELKKSGETRDIPVIMLSALKDLEDKVCGLDCGADDFLTKPCKALELLARIRAHIRVAQLHKELKQKNEELKKLGELKDNLTQLIVHDLKNPLASARGWLDIMSRGAHGKLSARQQDFAQKAMRSCDLELDMINDLMDITLIEQSSLQLVKTPGGVGELVGFCVKQMEIDMEKRGISLKKKIPARIPSLNADHRLIRRVLLNLLGNSLKFTPDGGAITVRAKRSKKEGRYVFSVSDTGRGIAPEHLKKVFDKFFKQEASKDASVYSFGKGLGLAFCKLAVESHGGKIWAESGPGGGTTISFTLPAGL
ncbi:MAG: hybrid sensor histidine kinase/response regulator [Elusimicrobiota bacterium]|nr:hybrid sensor histidine kinase/response regulator [Elusimicrobiota bacterium]